MGRTFTDYKKLKKKYLVLFIFIFILELIFVYYPNLREIYHLKMERIKYEAEIEKPVLKRVRHRNKMSREESIRLIDEMVSFCGMEVLQKKLESINEKRVLLEYKLKSDEQAMYKFFLREEWKKSHRIVNIRMEKQDSFLVANIQIECTEFE